MLEKKVVSIGSNIFGAILAFCIGVMIAALNYAVSRRVLQRNASRYVMLQMVKQLIQVAFLVFIFILGDYTPWDKVWLLVGGALGVTLPMFYFTYRLVKFNDSLHRKEDSDNG